MVMLSTALAIGLALVAIGGFVHAAMTEWHQTRDRGPVAIVPTLPLGVATPVVLTMALRLLGKAYPTLNLPWWAYVSFWMGSTVIAVVILRLVSHRRHD
jgi:hypothetical protein